MTSQASSSALSVDDMEKLMQEIENPEPVTLASAVTAAVESVSTNPAPVVVAAQAPAQAAAPAKPFNPIKSYVDPDQLKSDVSVDPDNLDGACYEHAGLVVHYGQKRAQARMQFEKMKAAFEILESQLYETHRDTLEKAAEAAAKIAAADETLDKKSREKGAAKITEGMVLAAVKSDRRWWAAKQRLINAQGQMELAGVATSAFDQRRDMIIQIGSDRRVERSGELRLSSNAGATKSARDGAMEIVRASANKG